VVWSTMFKKPVDVKTVQRLSGADKKKLRRTAKERFPQASDVDLDAILPPKGEITLAKYPNHALVYAIEGSSQRSSTLMQEATTCFQQFMHSGRSLICCQLLRLRVVRFHVM